MATSGQDIEAPHFSSPEAKALKNLVQCGLASKTNHRAYLLGSDTKLTYALTPAGKEKFSA